ncbi:hypothetical protein BCV70DRAFT_216520 [Testicularia cyperi]|uniref:Oligoxyloglucan reducing end-specific cellobiohydrolase n=1 Tax=Testicularia cyperi TaxID=1882483 RepID=A0A317XTI3_9BASI|nr:hypothetical protein BCV70DRAFT_216520 [Testicularia cyperi]
MLGYIFTLLVAALSVVSATPMDMDKRQTPSPYSNFSKRPVFLPPQNYPLWRSAYARTVQAADGALITTWENYPDVEPDWFPIFRSTDGGVNWSNYSQIRDTQNGWGMRFQPNLHVLEQAFAGYAKGTIIATGVSTPLNLKGPVWIDMYASTDNGKSWSFVSHIIYANGPETIDNGNAAIWEPYTMIYNNQMLIFYSDSRDPAHSQKLSYASSSDLKSWSASKDVIVYSAQGERPGMATIAYSPVSKKYVLMYEYCGSQGCRVHYRSASDPLSFASASDYELNANGSVPVSGPYIIYYKAPGASTGTFIASGSNDARVYLNNDAAASNTWKTVDVGQYPGYSRNKLIFNDNGTSKIHYITGGSYGCQGDCYNFVANGVGDIPTY